ncbi:MAG: DUF1488 family protein [Gammaproteobacteria bacterium]
MKLSSSGPRNAADGVIHFPILECWNPMTKCVSIAADVSGRRVLCRIAETVIKKRYAAQDGAPTAVVAANRREIEAAATGLIQRKAFAADGMIDIRFEDFREVG